MGPTAADSDATGPGGPRPKRPAEVRDIYRDAAHLMDRVEVLDRLALGRARARLFGRVSGRVLDVACGTGTNVRYLPDGVTYVGADLSPAMLDRAKARLTGRRGASLVEMDAATLAFADDSFDAVISSLSTCTFPDPDSALTEMARVCRPNGRIRLLEHGRSNVALVNRFLDWGADAHYASMGCRWNQRPRTVVERAGLEVESVRTGFFGLLTAMVVRPS